MASEVKWIKITTDIFDDEKMYAIETQQDGFLIELIWFKLLCLAGKCNNHGFLMINNKIAYTDEMLANIFRIEIGSIQRALKLFEQLEMIEVVENAYMIANWDKHQNMKGLEDYKEKHRIRQKAYRERQKKLALEEKTDSDTTCDVTVASQSDGFCSYSYSNSNNSLSLLNTKDKEKNKDTKSNKYIYYPNDEKLNQTFLDYVDMRKKIKAPMTDRAITLAMNTLNKLSGGDNDKAIAILEQSIMNSWKGLFELKGQYEKKSELQGWADA